MKHKVWLFLALLASAATGPGVRAVDSKLHGEIALSQIINWKNQREEHRSEEIIKANQDLLQGIKSQKDPTEIIGLLKKADQYGKNCALIGGFLGRPDQKINGRELSDQECFDRHQEYLVKLCGVLGAPNNKNFFNPDQFAIDLFSGVNKINTNYKIEEKTLGVFLKAFNNKDKNKNELQKNSTEVTNCSEDSNVSGKTLEEIWSHCLEKQKEYEDQKKKLELSSRKELGEKIQEICRGCEELERIFRQKDLGVISIPPEALPGYWETLKTLQSEEMLDKYPGLANNLKDILRERNELIDSVIDYEQKNTQDEVQELEKKYEYFLNFRKNEIKCIKGNANKQVKEDEESMEIQKNQYRSKEVHQANKALLDAILRQDLLETIKELFEKADRWGRNQAILDAYHLFQLNKGIESSNGKEIEPQEYSSNSRRRIDYIINLHNFLKENCKELYKLDTFVAHSLIKNCHTPFSFMYDVILDLPLNKTVVESEILSVDEECSERANIARQKLIIDAMNKIGAVKKDLVLSACVLQFVEYADLMRKNMTEENRPQSSINH